MYQTGWDVLYSHKPTKKHKALQNW